MQLESFQPLRFALVFSLKVVLVFISFLYTITHVSTENI